MRFLCALIGFLTGKRAVRCCECRHLDSDGRCYGHKMEQEIIAKTISCGFWEKKRD